MTRRAPAFWSVVFVLLKAAHKRASGRLRRLMQLDRHRDGRARRSWRVLVFGLVCLIATMPHLGTAIDIGISIPTAEQVQAEQSGRVVAEEWFVGRTEIRLSEAARSPTRRAQIMQGELGMRSPRNLVPRMRANGSIDLPATSRRATCQVVDDVCVPVVQRSYFWTLTSSLACHLARLSR